MVTVTADNTARLMESFVHHRDSGVRDRLVEGHMPLVRSIAWRFRLSREPQEDLVQVGVIGLLGAIDKFDPGRGVRFVSLAIPEVLGAMLNHLRDHGGLIKVSRTVRSNWVAVRKATDVLLTILGRWPTTAEVSEHCGLTAEEVSGAMVFARTGDPRSLDESISAGDDQAERVLLELLGQNEIDYEAALDRMILERAMAVLPLRERTIITLKFYQGMAQRQIGKRVHLSQMHVSRLERGALKKLRAYVLGENIEPPPKVVGRPRGGWSRSAV
jgi:RNA polymerase sigma-B factor